MKLAECLAGGLKTPKDAKENTLAIEGVLRQRNDCREAATPKLLL